MPLGRLILIIKIFRVLLDKKYRLYTGWIQIPVCALSLNLLVYFQFLAERFASSNEMATSTSDPITAVCIVVDPNKCPPNFELVYTFMS